MKSTNAITNVLPCAKEQSPVQHEVAGNGGLSIRTGLRAGLAWDDLDDQAQALWSNLTNTLSGLTGGSETSS